MVLLLLLCHCWVAVLDALCFRIVYCRIVHDSVFMMSPLYVDAFAPELKEVRLATEID